ncbi:MAG: type II secretion system F family protein [Acidimicrobiales bacterium]
MTGLAAAALGAYGVFLMWSAAALGWRGVGLGPRSGPGRRRPWRDWLRQAGLGEVRTSELAGAVGGMALVGAALAYALFGGVLPAALCALFAATLPVAAFRSRRRRRLDLARQAWPGLLEDLRMLTGSLGRSIPQALFEVGRRSPPDLAGPFRAAEREWLLTTDFERTVDLLKRELADPTADVVAETLLVAHQVGGGSLDRRLAGLVEDRRADSRARKDAAAKAAGVRFARRFVLIVPLGMALAGLSIGTGRSAYQTGGGQIAVAAGLAAVVGCWAWSGRLLRLPEEPRVFAEAAPAGQQALRQ